MVGMAKGLARENALRLHVNATASGLTNNTLSSLIRLFS